MSDYRVDRILSEDEINQLDNLLIPELVQEYPNFATWLKKAQNEILTGERVAIGIWKEKLIATSIIKFTTSDTAELKSFFIDPSYRDSGYGNTLYDETEKQCRKSGITIIITDTYVKNISMVEFLLSKGFEFAGRGDIYSNGKESYWMLKKIHSKYNGDPFDWEELGEWFLRQKINANNISNYPKVNDRTFDRHMRIISGDCELNLLVEIKDQDVDIDPVQILHSNCMTSEFQLPIFVGRKFSQRARTFAEKNGVFIFDSNDISRVIGEDPKKFREGPIAGMMVAIKPEFLNKLLDANKACYYIKGGPIGKNLQKGDTIVFYSTDPERKIRALGTVESIELDTPIEIWKKINEKTIFSEDEYYRFSSMKKRILAIYLTKIDAIAPIEGADLERIVPHKDKHGSYIDKEKLEEIITISKSNS